jgi:hypothetical protein
MNYESFCRIRNENCVHAPLSFTKYVHFFALTRELAKGINEI